MTEPIGAWLILLTMAGSLAYLVLAAVRGWWRLCQSLNLELLRGWKVNVPPRRVPWLFVACVIAPLAATDLGYVLLRLLVAWATGPPSHTGR